jgi:hypothetical protein
MKTMAKSSLSAPVKFAENLAIEELSELRTELQSLRAYPPLVKRGDGKYEGDILGFVKGLRLSARLIYFLRNRLSGTDLEVNWGHLVANGESCSPECDIIIHTKGHVRRWNGGDRPIMDFKFVETDRVRAVVSCKSSLLGIDKSYPNALKRYGVKHVFLFAECCRETQFARLQVRAKDAGYSGLWCLYLSQKGPLPVKFDEEWYVDFGKAILKAVAP